MRIGRNEPCPCGSGRKYKKCCLAKDADLKRLSKHTRKHEILRTNQIGDYGPPKLDGEFFNKNPFEDLTAPMFLYNVLLNPEIEMEVMLKMKQLVPWGKEEERAIMETNDVEGLIGLMKRSPEPINHRMLVNKILQQADLAIPRIIDELRYAHSAMFVELAATAIYKSKIDCSSALIDLVKLPPRDAYALSTVCLILGMMEAMDAVKPLWDCYHFFKERYPDRSLAQGPLIGLYELKSKADGSAV